LILERVTISLFLFLLRCLFLLLLLWLFLLNLLPRFS
jgi:hypothetical protein